MLKAADCGNGDPISYATIGTDWAARTYGSLSGNKTIYHYYLCPKGKGQRHPIVKVHKQIEEILSTIQATVYCSKLQL
jgi:hypothetical protein